MEVVMGTFPTCWELEAMPNYAEGGAEQGAEDENGDIYVRIRVPHSEMALGFKEDRAGEPVLLTNTRKDVNTYWRLSPRERQQVVNTPPISTTATVMTPATITTTITPTTVTITTTVARTVTGDV